MRCVHFIGFNDERYWSAVRIWGKPHFIHRRWDRRAKREICDEDILVFAEGNWTDSPSKYNGDDIDEGVYHEEVQSYLFGDAGALSV